VLLAGAFFMAIMTAWFRGLDVSCGCFGHSESATSFPLHLAGNALMIVAASWLLTRERTDTAL
jgi:hypothetical protein